MSCYFILLKVAFSSLGKDLFGAEPFDPFTCGAADFPPDIQSKLDEMQVTACLWIISKWTGVNEQLMELTVGTVAVSLGIIVIGLFSYACRGLPQ